MVARLNEGFISIMIRNLFFLFAYRVWPPEGCISLSDEQGRCYTVNAADHCCKTLPDRIGILLLRNQATGNVV